MHSVWKTKLFLGVAAMFVAAGSLGAADLAGSFTLPSEVNWGLATVPAGHYTFTLDNPTGTQKIITIRQGSKGIALILLQAYWEASSSDNSSMQIVDHRVRSLHLASLGVTYDFPGHKNERERLAGGAGSVAAVILPVHVE